MSENYGVTLNSIAKHCGVSRRKLNQIMQEGPDNQMTEMIAEALGCARCDLVEIHWQMGELDNLGQKISKPQGVIHD
ncbi:XRE family transcriptional regulator [Pantoea sp. ME81]|uniref:XRE family transcriptional regulator n=1 Tax=Pantoea sp. ME81 TaxID=2743935 RepID=UPI0021075D9C|nr:XRE family transcriptional regulator [Pantoea sp. ME81]